MCTNNTLSVQLMMLHVIFIDLLFAIETFFFYTMPFVYPLAAEIFPHFSPENYTKAIRKSGKIATAGDISKES